MPTPRPFFWLHIKKGAGQTIRRALSDHYVATDRRRHSRLSTLALPQRNDWINNYRNRLGRYDFHRMRFARDIAYRQDEFARMYRFTFVRDPYDRAVSMWYYLDRRSATLSEPGSVQRRRFAAFLRRVPVYWKLKLFCRHAALHTRPVLPDITDTDGTTRLVEHVGHVESLQHDLDIVCDAIGVSCVMAARTNVGRRRTQDVPYVAYYDDECRELVERLFGDDISAFGYEFGRSHES